MELNANKRDVKTDARDDLKSLPMPELQAKLRSSPDGLSQAEAQKRLTQYGPMNSTSSEAARTVEQFRTGRRRSGRFGKMNPINKQTRTTRLTWPKG